MAKKKNSLTATTDVEGTAAHLVTKETGVQYEKSISGINLDGLYGVRCYKVVEEMKKNKISAIIFEDCEERRDPSIRYLTGFAGDGLFILTTDGSFLIPWDEALAEQQAHLCTILPYTRYGRDNVKAARAVLNTRNFDDKSVVELEPCTPYPLFLKYIDALDGWDTHCKEHGMHQAVAAMRAGKDEYEIACTRKACAITAHITDVIEKKIKSGTFKTETDVAVFIEKECRALGCERTGFDTLAAGPARSFAIHAFPGYTAGDWASKGLSILDYGVVYNGYTSDATITIARGPLSVEQKKLVALVQKAADECLPLYQTGLSILNAQKKADDIFAKAKRIMPHSLGHGIGLEIHESPFVSKRAEADDVFLPGNIVTLEPGLYDSELGGVRLENDVLVGIDGNVLLTNSRIITL